ncbi:hypothetical protein K474DRAFT_1709112 [Panus rudis PR-1116 ss-1]|nr:hypothetical protein K474DRAFT_1709112 [Panus rudis PR-1116 ss-1]
MTGLSSATKVEDPEEQLARFREQWKAEVRQRLQQSKGTAADASTSTGGNSLPSTSEHVKAAVEVPTSPPFRPAKSDTIPVTLTSLPTSTSPSTTTAAQPHVPISPPRATSHAPIPLELGHKQRAAVDVYRQAIAMEQSGKLDEATELYRKAFRMHDQVDRVFRTLEAQQQWIIEPTHHHPHPRDRHSHPPKHGHGHGRTSSRDMTHITEGMRTMEVSLRGHKFKTTSLPSLISAWPYELTFEPEDEREPIAINKLPDELLLYILSFLDVTSIERFGSVNRKARLITLDPYLWRLFVGSIYIPPQIAYDEEIEEVLESDYLGDYRRLYVEHPRIRLDGVYIAVCHYIRNGLSENAWVNITQLITYHRYLRFYPDGTVLSLLANEEISPQQIIPMLKPNLNMKGFFIGQWRLTGTTIHITSLTDPTGLTSSSRRYTFQMTLELRSKPVLGKWNRLDMKAYDSVNVDTGEATPVALKNDRPFWFSKVRSYAM